MKTNVILSLGVGFLLAVVCGNLSAQNTQTTGKTSLTAGPQAVTNHVVTNPDVLVVTGKILDASTKQPIQNAKINFDKFGDELLQASIDAKGNYAIALNKVDKSVNYLDADIYLQPTKADEKSEGQVKYIMNEDPFNTMVIKMQ